MYAQRKGRKEKGIFEKKGGEKKKVGQESLVNGKVCLSELSQNANPL